MVLGFRIKKGFSWAHNCKWLGIAMSFFYTSDEARAMDEALVAL